MSCCSISKAFRKLDAEASRVGEDIKKNILDPVEEEASRIESKTRAELGRIPDNIDKAVTSAKERVSDAFDDVKDFVSDTLGQIVDVIPGSGAIKLIGIGIGAIILLSIFRRVGKT